MNGAARKTLNAIEDRLDKRRPRARRFAQLVTLYTNDLDNEPSNAQRVLIRDLATLILVAEDLQARLIEDDHEAEDVRDYARLSSSIKSTMRKLGLTGTRDQDDEYEQHDPDLDRPVRQRL
jgi:hypothetical protein